MMFSRFDKQLTLVDFDVVNVDRIFKGFKASLVGSQQPDFVSAEILSLRQVIEIKLFRFRFGGKICAVSHGAGRSRFFVAAAGRQSARQ